MLHPDFHHVTHLANIKTLVRGYKAAYKIAAQSGSQHADAWAPVKEAERAINAAVEAALSPK